MRVRFHLDEHIPYGVAAGLRRRGVNVTCAAEVGLAAASDLEQLAFAQQSGRVMVTHDADFLRLNAAGTPHSGIAYCAQGLKSTGEVLRRLVLIYDLLTADEMRGRVEFL